MDEMKPTAPGEIRRRTKLVVLPVEQEGVQIAVRIGALPALQVMNIMEGVPGVEVATEASAQVDIARVRETYLKGQERVRLLIEAAAIEPRFYFGEPEEGKASWDALDPDNQAALMKESLALSGWKGAEKPEQAAFREGGEK